MNNELEQEARILYGIVYEGITLNGVPMVAKYHFIPSIEKKGWERLAAMVLVDSKAKPAKIKKTSMNGYAIPIMLITAEFPKAWEAWLKDRKDRRKPVTEQAAKMQLAKCEAMGSPRAVAAIYNSIEKGYQSIFEAKSGFKKVEEDDENKVGF